MWLRSSHTTPWSGGWFVAFDYFECDVGGARFGFYDEGLRALTMLETTWPGVTGAAPHGEGIAFLGHARPDVVPTRLTTIDEPGSPPSMHEIAADGTYATLAPWPFGAPADLALVFVDREPEDDSWRIQLVVVSEDGAERLNRRLALPNPYEARGYGATSITAAAADFGLVVVITFEWEGGREDAGYVIVTLGRDGTSLGGAHSEFDLGVAELSADVASTGPDAVVSILPRGGMGTHQAILLGCPSE